MPCDVFPYIRLMLINNSLRLVTLRLQYHASRLHSSFMHGWSSTVSLIHMWMWGELISPWASFLHLTSVLGDPTAMSTQMVFRQRPDFYASSLLSSESIELWALQKRGWPTTENSAWTPPLSTQMEHQSFAAAALLTCCSCNAFCVYYLHDPGGATPITTTCHSLNPVC